MSILGSIIGWLNPLETITGKLVDAYAKAKDAKTEQARIEAEKTVHLLEAQRDVLIAEAPLKVNAYMRAFLAAPVAILLWKVFVFDKVLGMWLSWRTDSLSPELWQVVSVVIGFYFVSSAATSIASMFKR